MAAAAPQRTVSPLEVAFADGAAQQVYDVRGQGCIVAYLGPMEILRFDDLTHANNSFEFEGADHGGAGVSFFIVDAAPGRGPSLHTHEYPEIFIMLEGQAIFRGPDGETEVGAGHVVVVPAGEPHGFTATGDGSRQVNIHASPRFVTEWLEQEAYG
jgi:quercetin dioxygenase-like cupin family protein